MAVSKPGQAGAEDGLPASQAYTEARNAARRGLAEAGQGAWFGALDGELVSQLGVFPAGARSPAIKTSGPPRSLR